MPPFPSRRWLQFSVRTLLVVVTVVAVWLGWQLNLVRSRREIKNRLHDEDATFYEFDVPEKPGWHFVDCDALARDFARALGHDSPTISFWREWMGDSPVLGIFISVDPTQAELDEAASLFPEADIHLIDGTNIEAKHRHSAFSLPSD